MQQNEHSTYEKNFASGLVLEDTCVPVDLFMGDVERIEAGWKVYRNNVTHSLTEALADTFPVTAALVGQKFFSYMARLFLLEHFPSSPILSGVGKAFPEFVSRFEPARELLYLSDVARLELAILQSLGSGEAEPMSASALLDPAEGPGERCLYLHPSVRTVSSNYAIEGIWSFHQQKKQSAGRIDWRRPESVLLFRMFQGMKILSISRTQAAFIRALHSGKKLSLAVATALNEDPDFELEKTLALLLGNELIVVPPESEEQERKSRHD